MKDKGTPREVIGTSGTSENLVKTSGVPSPRDELAEILADDERLQYPALWGEYAAEWLDRHGVQVLALIDAAAKTGDCWCDPIEGTCCRHAVAPLISPPQPEGDT